jgi:hypoxanthine phosphoribosyltransferase
LNFKNQNQEGAMYETEKFLVYEQKDFEEDVERLAKMLADGDQIPLFLRFDGIYGIPAGGNVLATYLHYRLKLPLLQAPTRNSLVVDDIVDSGKTMAHYIEKGMFCLSLFYRRQSPWVPNIWLHEKTDKWIHFPWEAPEDGDDRLAR